MVLVGCDVHYKRNFMGEGPGCLFTLKRNPEKGWFIKTLACTVQV